MRLYISFVTVLSLARLASCRITSIGSYSSDDFSDVEFPDDREECMDGSCSLYTEKRYIVPEKVVEHRQLVPRLTIRSNSADLKELCNCVTEIEISDLGEGHYPRYITKVKCKSASKMCQIYYYKIQVLVNRRVSTELKNGGYYNNRDVEELTLPKSLHANWQLFAIFVPVFCGVSKPT